MRTAVRSFAAVLVAAAVSALAVAPAGAQDPCSGTIGGAEGTPVLERGAIVDVGGAFYIDAREVAGADQLFSIWVYQETNGLTSLQRGNGTTPEPLATIYAVSEGLLTSSIDPCVESGNPDTILF